MSFHSLNYKAENKRNISDGFINGFLVQSLYLLSATVLSLKRFLARTLLPSPWLLMVRPVLEPNNHDHRADLRRILQPWAGCTNLPHAKGTSSHHIFSLSSISSPYVCPYRQRLLPLCCCHFLPLTLLPQNYFPPLPLIPPSLPV